MAAKKKPIRRNMPLKRSAPVSKKPTNIDNKEQKQVKNEEKKIRIAVKKRTKKLEKARQEQEEIITNMQTNPVTRESVTFGKSFGRMFEAKAMLQNPLSWFLCLFLSIIIAVILAACMQGIVYGSALIYGTHIKENLVNDFQLLLKALYTNNDPNNPYNTGSLNGQGRNIAGEIAADLVVGGLAGQIDTYINGTFSYLHYLSGANGGVYLELFGVQIFLVTLLSIFIIGFIVMLFAFYLQHVAASKISLSTERRIRVNLLRKMLFHDYSFFIENKVDSLIESYVNGPQNIGEFIRNCVTIKINIITTILAIAVSLFINDKIYAAINIASVFCVVAIGYVASTLNTKILIRRQIIDEENNFSMTERILSSRHIKSNGTWDMEFELAIDEITGRKLKTLFTNFMLAIGTSTVLTSITLLIFISAVSGVLYYQQDYKTLLSQLTSFISGSLIIVGQLYRLQTYNDNKQIAKININNITRILAKEIVVDKFSDTGRMFRTFNKKIQFKNLSFAYPDEPEKILVKNLNLTIEKGSKVGVIGPSGCGKSTLVKLLLGYYSPIEGEVLIDGVNLEEYNLQSWLEKVAYIDQTPQLLSLSVFENLTYGIKKFTSNEVIEAAKKARVHDLISGWTDKYKTVLENGGERLSGGQKQRFTIARMILRKAELALLDEATSKLDNITELEVMEEIVDILNSQKVTCLSIAHRLKSLSGFDRVIKMAPKVGVVSDGKFADMIHVSESLSFLDPLEYQKEKRRRYDEENNQYR